MITLLYKKECYKRLFENDEYKFEEQRKNYKPLVYTYIKKILDKRRCS